MQEEVAKTRIMLTDKQASRNKTKKSHFTQPITKPKIKGHQKMMLTDQQAIVV